jgi:alkylated DNA nucleotide flippase Atl1
VSATDSNARRVYALVRQIPQGKVMSYGQVARACPPLTPRQVGRLMAAALEDDIPWWRVVGSDGSLRIHKRDPLLPNSNNRSCSRKACPSPPTGASK